MRTLLPVVPGIAGRVEPLQPTPGPPFHRPGWVYEEKYDGWRMVAYKSGPQVRLISRHGRDHTTRFRAIAEAIAGLPAPTLVLDGEVAAFDQHLVSHFPLLRPSTPSAVVTPPILVAFDCLYARGQDFRAHPLSVRRLVLEQEIAGQDVVLPARRLATNGLQAWKEVQRRGYEGLVAKDEASTYLRGGRSTSWLKVKVRREGEFQIGGIVASARGNFAGILVGRVVEGRFHLIGHVEAGFTRTAVVDLLTRGQRLVRATTPFHDGGHWPGVIWLEPALAAEVTFAKILHGQLRDAAITRVRGGGSGRRRREASIAAS